MTWKEMLEPETSNQNGSTLSSKLQVTSSNDKISTDVQALVNSFQEKIASKLNKYVRKFEIEAKEKNRLATMLEAEKEKSTKLEKEKCEMTEKISKLNEAIEHILGEKYELDEKIKALLHNLNFKATELNQWIIKCNNLRNRNDSFSENLTSRLQEVIPRVIQYISLCEVGPTEDLEIHRINASNEPANSSMNSVFSIPNLFESSENDQFQSIDGDSTSQTKLEGSLDSSEIKIENFDSNDRLSNRNASDHKRLHEFNLSSNHKAKRQKTVESSYITMNSDVANSSTLETDDEQRTINYLTDGETNNDQITNNY